MQLYSPALASEVKLTLMEHYPDDHQVVLVRAAGVKAKEKVLKILFINWTAKMSTT